MQKKNRATAEVEIDFDRLARIGNKINELLRRKTHGNAEAYATLRFLCVYYEEDLGIIFDTKFEEELRKVVKKCLKQPGS
jgi:hypothetical protein